MKTIPVAIGGNAGIALVSQCTGCGSDAVHYHGVVGWRPDGSYLFCATAHCERCGAISDPAHDNCEHVRSAGGS